ncbi:MAG: sugar phosphate isomerase/epimerase [Maribacter sp.]
MKRRKALKNTIIGLGGISLLSSFTKMESLMNLLKVDQKIGIQLFTIPFLVDNDFEGALKMLSEMGYREIELFGPYPFSHDNSKQVFTQMQQMLNLKQHSFYGKSAKETSELMKDLGLTVPSVHCYIDSLRYGMNDFLEGMKPLAPKYAVIPALMNPEDRNSKEAYLKLAEEFNGFGKQMKAHSMKFAYHNHGYEHIAFDGEMGLDILLNNTDPEFVQFELDIFWMKAAGQEPIDYLKKYPNRFKMMHVKDAAKKFRFKGDGSTPDQWMEGFPLMSDPGDGIFDIQAMIEQGIASGVEHFYLERDMAPEPEQTLKNSIDKLNKMM